MYVRWSKEWMIPSAVGVISFGVGVGVGYAVKHYQTKSKVEELESAQAELAFNHAQINHEFNHNIQQMSKVIKEFRDEGRAFIDGIVTTIQTESRAIPEEQEEPEIRPRSARTQVIRPEPDADLEPLPVNVFSAEDNDWDYEEELKTRGPDRPFIVHRDEYFSQEADGYSQSTLTWYNGDSILVDEHDVPIYGHENIVGELIFGKGSGDKNVVYVRNDKLEAEYEVLFDPGSYLVEVLGEQVESSLSSPEDIRHSITKFRQE